MKKGEWLHQHWTITIVGRFPFLRRRRVTYTNIGFPVSSEGDKVWDCICGYHA